ncbi:hypothetical protein Godav_027883, partial [Gossypium davidsonii]|nr:hypothetical protein [Gossypium davidsonii]MBA0653930.1 hypothetical protein [Gossypium klotzschianum]
PHFSVYSHLSVWTVGHPSPMWYTLGPSYFPITVMYMMM